MRAARAATSAVAILLASNIAHAAEHVGPHLPRREIAWPDSIDPDEPQFRFDLDGGRQRAMFGARLGMYGFHTDAVSASFCLDPMLELVNFDEANPVPWESFRAAVGLSSLWVVRAGMPRDGRLFGKLGWVHESDHVAADEAYRSLFLRPGHSYNNGNFSSYEWLDVALGYAHDFGRVSVQLSLGARIFTPSINAGDTRNLRHGQEAEARVSVHIHGPVHASLAAFYELLHHDHHVASSPFFETTAAPLPTRRLELGLDLETGQSTLGIHFLLTASQGRGVTFPRRYPVSPGATLSFRP